ncbi:MAG TPA: hypothetical protein DIS76_05255, partial [Rhodospirillaceae bacterium]|nr:hypothetical protein [Rhodospirillaceae bacterium]
QGVDLAFPVIHGAFGEDGELQKILEDWNVPYVGATADACRRMFYKNNAQGELKKLGMDTLPHVSFNSGNARQIISDFFAEQKLTRAVVKPVAGGSSIGVSSVTNADEAIAAAKRLLDRTHDAEVMLEPFCEGREFTVVVIQNENGEPVALLPSEIEVSYAGGAIFDFRRKYLPTSQATYHCPPRFGKEIIQQIRAQAERIFMHFGARDFVRLDGWLLDDGRLLFTDLNPISGMEQNSFLFQQAARVGLSHRQILARVLASATKRHGKKLPSKLEKDAHQQAVHVICGGNTAERQVSLMSGTNVWLKLRQSHDYVPSLFLLSPDNQTVFQVPYAYALSHTVEEVLANCENADNNARRTAELLPDITARLPLQKDNLATAIELPQRMTLSDFIEKSAKESAFVFLGLHGGIGEDGTLQRRIGNAGLYNGSGPEGAALCMDKFRTGEAIRAMNDANILTAPKHLLSRAQLLALSRSQDAGIPEKDFKALWTKLTQTYQARHLIMKPQSDGCSAGIVRLTSADDLAKYAEYVLSGADHIPAGTLPEQHGIIELGAQQIDDFMLEVFIETDKIVIQNNTLHHTALTGWLELTVGVLEQNGHYHSLSPSITVAEGSVLSLEEKFQGGTGINITPPPAELFSDAQIAQIKRDIEKTAAALKIENYARIDIFFNIRTSQMLVIEANALPGLTPSTVIYHQALAERSPLYPREFLELLIKLKSRSVTLQQQVAA